MFRAKGGDTMESIIEELYYGNITPLERSCTNAEHRVGQTRCSKYLHKITYNYKKYIV